MMPLRAAWIACVLSLAGCGPADAPAPATAACDDAGATCSPAAEADELSRDELERQLDRIEQEITADDQR